MDGAALAELFPDPKAVSDVDAKGYVQDAFRDATLRKCRMKSDNRNCFECGSRSPVWCSVTFGVYLCLDCSGNHRRKGTHISFVRSVDMDKFYPDQLVQMALGGNGKAINFFKDAGMGRGSTSGRAVDFTSKNALKYKADLEKLVQTTCATLGVSTDRTADAEIAEAEIASNGEVGVAAAAAAPEVVWTVGQKMQFRDQGNPTWKWGHVTHCKPLKIDYAAHNEIRASPASKIYDPAAQRAIAFAVAPTSTAPVAAVPKVKPASPTISPAAAPKAPAVPTIRKAAAAPVVRRADGAAPASAPDGAGGYPTAQPQKQVGKELDFDYDFGDIQLKKPSPKMKAASPPTSPALAPTGPPAATSPKAAPAPAPKPKVVEDDFDWDF